jgi:hypothetical protein
MSNTPTPSTTNQPGRPLMKFDLEKVEELASRGLTYRQLATALGVNLKTIQKHKKINQELQAAIDLGRAKGLAEVSNSLFESATGGNVTAQIFYLKNRSPDDWRDRYEQKVDIKADVTALHLAAIRQISDGVIESTSDK